MKQRNTIYGLAVVIALIASTALGQNQNAGKKAVAPAASSAAVTGSGTTGQLVKWTGSTNTSSTVGDSYIFEDKFGKVGIGTKTPTSLLTVQGMIETTLGGFKFPDGTVQTTVGLSASEAVTSINGMKGDLKIKIFPGMALQNSGDTITIGVSGPLNLSNFVDNGNGSITVLNAAPGGPAIFATGGNASAVIGGGSGVLALGGTGSGTSPGGVGTVSFGGSASSSNGGTGGSFIGGVATAGNGGDGLFAVGALGVGTGKKGGRGIIAIPGGGAGGATAGLAGDFLGDVEISGNLSKGGGSFKIDHPLDPENKYLYHSFVESPDMKNIYDGNITTDANGDAVVEMPDYFEALNRDFHYQLTVIGQFAQAIVAEKIKGNRFRIKTNAPNVEVSWQITGVRQDAYANKHRIPLEEVKNETERGFYLHPDAFNQPQERSVMFANHPEAMRSIQEQQEQIKQKQKASRLQR